MTFFETISQYQPLFLSGAYATLYVTSLATILALGLGLVLSLLDGVSLAPVRWLCRTYIEIMRGTPVLIVLFMLYYGGPSIGLLLDPTFAGVVGLGFYGAAYFAEIFRAGFQSIPRGQIEAAQMLCLSRATIVLRIKLPQMLRLIIPALFGQIVMMFKESALLSIITVNELTKVATQIVNETSSLAEPYIAVTIIYWVIIEAVALCGRSLERRFSHGA